MLPGGISVIGIFIFSPEESFKISQPSITKVVLGG